VLLAELQASLLGGPERIPDEDSTAYRARLVEHVAHYLGACPAGMAAKQFLRKLQVVVPKPKVAGRSNAIAIKDMHLLTDDGTRITSVHMFLHTILQTGAMPRSGDPTATSVATLEALRSGLIFSDTGPYCVLSPALDPNRQLLTFQSIPNGGMGYCGFECIAKCIASAPWLVSNFDASLLA